MRTQPGRRGGASGSITGVRSGPCLDVAGADNTTVQRYACHGGSDQRWTRS